MHRADILGWLLTTCAQFTITVHVVRVWYILHWTQCVYVGPLSLWFALVTPTYIDLLNENFSRRTDDIIRRHVA